MTAFISLLSSCSDQPQKDQAIFKETAYGFYQSAIVIAQSNKEICGALDDRLHDRFKANEAAIWQPKAIRIKAINE
ncbi:MAG: hypothetical protein ABUT20_51150, partial [Bacteroidota bacterium]